jgi:DNA-binding beta-propeller fold protein YncE
MGRFSGLFQFNHYAGRRPTPSVVGALIGVAALLVTATVLSVGLNTPVAQSAERSALELEAKIPLGDGKGRIDHMAYDPKRNRIIAAEVANNTARVVDLRDQRVIHVVTGLTEPQGIGYVPSSDMIYVANGGDGSVRLFHAEDLRPAGRIELGEDADNVRVDVSGTRVFVGYGSGALAIIDPANRTRIADIPLKAHPEGFQVSRADSRIFVNLPKTRELAILDRAAGSQIATIPMSRGGNFPMALDEAAQRILLVFRDPPGLGVFSATDGRRVTIGEACGDADDLFLDPKRRRVYISCGDGHIDVLDAQSPTYQRISRIPTARGARTSFFTPAVDRFLLAVPASAERSAELWSFRPMP